MKKFFLVVSLIQYVLLLQAAVSDPHDSTINQTDSKGFKQGHWIVKYDNGKIKYEGIFKDNHPVGELKRFYDDGVIKAVMIFDQSGTYAKAKIYYDNGELAAEGNYYDNLKDSLWKYYSYYSKYLTGDEVYQKGKKNGVSHTYYSNGKIAEELEYQDNMMNGIWKQYYDNGQLKLETSYIKDIRSGSFTTYYPNGTIETFGYFANNLMDKKWQYFDDKGTVRMTVEYSQGIPKDPTILDQNDKAYFDLIESNKGKFPEPKETDLIPK
jgi:antitoxin component YwqK of YwqJK toxin-antitoxin module